MRKMYSLFLTGVVMLSMLLAGCGASNLTMSSPRVSVRGVAATGAPIAGTVTLKDSSATPRVRTVGTNADGSFTVDTTDLVAPYVLRVAWSDATGTNQLFAVTDGPGITNINPFSNVTYAAAAEASDSSALAADPDPSLIRSTSERHGSVKNSLMEKLAPLFALYSTSNDPEHDEYEADHTGLDALFDDVNIRVHDGMVIVTNKATGAIIFKASVHNIGGGTFYPENMPGYTGSGTLDGAALYGTYCSSCHGPLATSSKRGVTVSQIQSAISRVSAMKSLSNLTTTQVQAIATALGTTTTPPSACTYTYDSWSTCQSNNTKTRNMLTSSPAGCTGTPVLSQSCTYVPPTCTYNYDSWTACQSNNTQTRNMLTATPAGCTGTPVISQSCTYAPAACTYTYSVWSACQSNNTQTRTTLTSSPAGCTGTPVLSQSCTYVPSTCSYTYDAWSACQSNNTQTRNMLTSAPAGCTGTPIVSQSCTYVPPTCSYTYSAWAACQSNNTQTRNMLTSAPAGCSGTPVVSQTCTYTPPSVLTLAQVKTTCTQCHGLTVNTTVLKSGGYTVTGRTASAWLSAITGMGATPVAGTTLQDYANFLATLP